MYMYVTRSVSGGGGFARLAVALRWATIDPASQAHVEGRHFYTRVLPVGVFMATSIALGNAAYLYLGVFFINRSR